MAIRRRGKKYRLGLMANWLVVLLIMLAFFAQGAAREAFSADPAYFLSVTPPSYSLTSPPSLESPHWVPVDALPNMGLHEAPVWIAFDLSNPAPHQKLQILRFRHPLLQTLTLYQWNLDHRDQPGIRLETGSLLPIQKRALDDNMLAIPLALPPQTQVRILIEARSSFGLALAADLSSPEEYLNHRTTDSFLQGLYFGLSLILSVVSLVLWLALRDPTFGYYSLFNASFALWMSTHKGLAILYLWPDSPQWNEQAFLTLMIVAALMSVQFTRHFLRLSEKMPALENALKWLARIWVFMLPVSLVLPLAIGFALVVPILLVGGCILLLSGILAWKTRQPGGAWYTLAWSLLISGAIVQMAIYLGWVPLISFTQHWLQVGSTLEGLLLAIGLGRRLSSDWRARSTHLKNTVRERTAALEKVLEQLADANQDLQRLSNTDPLTGLLNRRAFFDRATALWQQSLRHQHPFSLILIDVDHFKRINDQFGHAVGDACLQHIAQQLQNGVRRGSDLVSRHGGEELLIALPDTDEERALATAEALRRQIETTPLGFEDMVYRLTVSAGVATRIPDQGDTLDSLLETADQRLYQAKNDGRNRVVAAD